MTLDELKSWLSEFARLVAEHRDELTELDAAIGDADHGTNMDRGMTAVVENLDGDTIGAVCKQAGMTLVRTVGGASGPLYGTFWLRFGVAAGEVTSLSAAGLAAAMRAGLDGVVARGKAEHDDKTMFDALAPAVEVIETGGTLQAAADAADKGRDATIEMLARKGRASYLGERSVGHQDPGATSAALLIRAAASAMT
ncbi:MAG TPA: dihydroxyacetone kinase subunit DhaL [Jatrophihabitantaceae bacterium]|jgi:dihydroxyacetone kinase-like protein|nr:dihydroxyacetone kinase subunit DhaL [Jatrophihabitantaceae bacterium]